MTLHTYPSASIVAAEAAEAFIRLANECIEATGVFRVALAGGSTPKKMYEMLREATLSWGKVEFYFSDERFVPVTDEQSNERMAREALLSHISSRAIHGMVTADDAEGSAIAYRAVIPESMDLILLGLGTDGHTASLFPGEPGVHETSQPVIAAHAPVNAPIRITMTPTYINSAKNVWFIITGPDKAEPMWSMLKGEEDWSQTPSQAIARYCGNLTIFADKAASERL